VQGLTQAAKEMNPTAPETIFLHHHNAFDVGDHDGQTPEDAKDMEQRKLALLLSAAWEGYGTSEFSWQPVGDSPTRRAFYVSM
jgi:hypothetical protein